MGRLFATFDKSPRLFGIPCWTIPIAAGCTWLVSLIAMVSIWALQGRPIYPNLAQGQTLAYISDIASTDWGKPLFMTSSAFTVLLFGTAFGIERWLRHKGLLLHVASRKAHVLSAFASFFTIIGAVGAILLTIFDKKRHFNTHLTMVGVFIGGYVLAAISMALEKFRLSKKYPSNFLIRLSWLTKAAFAAIQLLLTGIFCLFGYQGPVNVSVVMEWFLALFFIFYVWSFAMDFLPVSGDEEKDSVDLIRDAANMGSESSIVVERNDSNVSGGSLQTLDGKDIQKGWDIEMVGLSRPRRAMNWVTTRTKYMTRTTELEVEAFQMTESGGTVKWSGNSGALDRIPMPRGR